MIFLLGSETSSTKPEEKPITKACNKSDHVLVYPFNHAAHVWWKGLEGKVNRQSKLEVLYIDSEVAQQLGSLAERSMQLQATIQEGGLILSSNLGTVQIEPQRWK